jgi:hypothetical protein
MCFQEMKEEIQRRLSLVQNVRFEPTLLSEQVQNTALTQTNHYFHRMKALDAFTNAGLTRISHSRAQAHISSLFCNY